MSVTYVPYTDPNKEFKESLLMIAQILGQKRQRKQEGLDIRDIVNYTKEMQTSPGQMPTPNGMTTMTDLQNLGQWITQAKAPQFPMPRTEYGQNLAQTLLMGQMQTPLQRAQTEYYGARTKAVGEEKPKKPPTPLRPSMIKSYNEGMKDFIKQAKHWRVGKKNYNKSDLLESFDKFKEASGYSEIPLSHKRQLWDSWKERIKRLGNEAEFNPTDPDWLEASELGGQRTEDSMSGVVRPEEQIVSPTEPGSLEEFERKVAELKTVDMKKAREYYDKWADKWQ
jgi:hypothetical protein